jgi:amino acid adenylation domain-containing protein/thioester reductase-like protein
VVIESVARAPIVERIAAQVRARPASPCVVWDGRVALTYDELWSRAGAIAARLSGLGYGPESVVALSLPRCPAWPVAALGCWRAGAAILPVHPEAPRERLRTMLAETGAACTVTSAPVAESTPAGLVVDPIDAHLVSVRAGISLQSSSSRLPPSNGDEPRDRLAWVIYTSGSTGRPKGVAVTHRGVLPFVDAQIETFALESTSRALWVLSPIFDASLSDTLTVLAAGATLAIESVDPVGRPPQLLDLLGRLEITHIDLPPSILAVLDPQRAPRSLEAVVIGGEVCPPEVVRSWAQRCRVVNVYGPTEATVCTSMVVCGSDWERPDIGVPVPGVAYHVYDAEGTALSGEQERAGTGELYIEGDALARGYVGRPELDAQRFVARDGRRMYRTGDLVEVVPCDVASRGVRLIFAGRIDRQIKLRGRLVVPEEIEARLSGTRLTGASITEAAVVVTGSPGRERLVACVVADGARPSTDELRSHLAAHLPDWMIPGRFEFLEVLPRTSTGKVDLEVLERRCSVPLHRRARGDDAHTPREAVLAEIWREILGVDRVDAGDDFFELGGDSFGVIEMLAMAEERGLPLTAEHIHRARTLGAIAAAEARSAAEHARSAAELRRDIAPTLARLRGISASDAGAHDMAAPRCILYTGVTGFLGARLAAELLGRTGATLVCLVRAPDDEAALCRARRTIREAGGDPSSRLEAFAGDLTLPRFGLDTQRYDLLAARVDTIHHVAARVHLTLPYEALRPTNIGGTREVLAFALTGRARHLHFASTLSVFVASDRPAGVMREDDDLGETRAVYGGYAQTKWAAEVMVRRLADSLERVSIYRYGLLTGARQTGRAPSSDLLQLLLRGTAQLGCFPLGALERLAVDITPVDYAAAATAALSQAEACAASEGLETFHIASPRSANAADLVEALATSGWDIDIVEDAVWRARLAEHLSGGADPALAAVLLGLCRCVGGSYERHRTLDLFQATDAIFDRSGTLEVLEGSGIGYEGPTVELLARYV